MSGIRIRDERGVALVEFALVLPLLLLMLFGMLEFGKAFNYWLDANHLANEGVRFAVVNKNPGAPAGQTLQQWVKAQGDTNEFRNGGTNSVPTAPQVTICFPDGATANDAGNAVRVKVAVSYNLLPFLSNSLGIGQVQLVGTATQRIERAAKAPLTPAYTADNGGVCT
jgi:Flp pilus assembly protein TadG